MVNTAIHHYEQQSGSLDTLIRYSLDDITRDYLTPSDYEWVKFAYPYDAKFKEGNAQVVSKILHQHYRETFYHLNGGLSKIIKRLKSKLKNSDIRLQTRCLSVDVTNDQSEPYYRVQVIKQEEILETIYTKNLIVAIPPQALQQINWNCLNLEDTRWIQSYPLYRIYAIYPKQNGNVWFHHLGRVITDNPLRYIIPINPDQGLIMISYLSGDLARDVHQYASSDEKLSNFIAGNLRKLFPTKKIPKPTFLQGYYWDPGVHVYTPGINPDQQVKYWSRPGPDPLWVIGESYSKYQGWMEGSLSTAEISVRQLLIRLRLQVGASQSRAFQIIPTKIPVNLPDYTLPDVQLHNTRDDAWIALFGYVYNVTGWISVHPGGDAILKGIGKEYSREWKQVSSHRMRRSDISKLLNKYLIGRFIGSGINTAK